MKYIVTNILLFIFKHSIITTIVQNVTTNLRVYMIRVLSVTYISCYHVSMVTKSCWTEAVPWARMSFLIPLLSFSFGASVWKPNLPMGRQQIILMVNKDNMIMANEIMKTPYGETIDRLLRNDLKVESEMICSECRND